VIHAHAAVVAHGALHLGEVLHAQQRQRLQVGRSSSNMACTWRRSVPWMREAAHLVSQCSRNSFCSSMVSKRRPFKAVAWVWPMAFSTVPLRLGSRTRAGSATTS
jgi:hypothetical protein